MNVIYISPVQQALILKLLDGEYQILAFGSRVTGKHLPYSDLDICLKSQTVMSSAQLEVLQGRLEESDLPFVVDLIDYSRLAPEFKALIDEKAIPLDTALAKGN